MGSAFTSKRGLFTQLRNPVIWGLLIALAIGGLYFSPEVTSFSNVIVYACEDEHDLEICVVNADGSDHRIITNNQTDDSSPMMNKHGLIVYECEFLAEYNFPQNEICVINLDGSGFRRLTNDIYDDLEPRINDDGWIAYTCEQRPKYICRAHATEEVRARIWNDTLQGQFANINNDGLITFACRDESDQRYYDICTYEPDLKRYQRISDLRLPVLSLDANNHGQLTFECSPARSLDLERREICVMRDDGSDFRVVTENNIMDGSPSINDHGVIVYECDLNRSSNEEICAVHFDGTGFVRLTHDNYDGGLPSINNEGRVAHVCGDGDFEICIVHADGTGFQKLTKNFHADKLPTIQ